MSLDAFFLGSISKEALRALGFRKIELQTPEALKAKKEIANVANRQMIDRAISNYFDLTQREIGEMGKFKELVIWGENA